MMDRAEEIVATHLKTLGYTDIVHEPDGNVPPDFVLDGRIAVEVRRLNENYVHDEGYRGLEEDERPLVMSMSRLLASLGPAQGQRSWFVSYDFARPLPSWKVLKSEITRVLKVFKGSQVKERTEWALHANFRLSVFKAESRFEDFYVLGGTSDQDSGGWLMGLLEQNIRRCVAEKSQKTLDVRERYPEWWLLLVDHIGYGLMSTDEQERFRNRVRIEHDWDRICLISPLNPQRWFEI